MDSLPRDALSLIVEALRPCERKAVRQVSRAWRHWPCRPRRAECHRRPAPVLQVAVYPAMLTPPNRPRGPLRLEDPYIGSDSWWWGMACQTVVLELGPGTAMRSYTDHDVRAWVLELLSRVVPTCGYLVIDRALCDKFDLGDAWPPVLKVIVSQQAQRKANLYPVEVASDTQCPLAPWGMVIPLPLKIVPDELRLWRQMDATTLQTAQAQIEPTHDGVCIAAMCGQEDHPHRFWTQDASAEMRCEILQVVIGCKNSFCPPPSVPVVSRAFPLLRSLRVEGGSTQRSSRLCIRHATAVITSAPGLRSVHLKWMSDTDLADVVRALGQRELHPVDLHFTGTRDQLFLLVMGCDDKGRLRESTPFARRRFVLASVVIECTCAAQAMCDLIETYEKNARTLTATATALRSLFLFQKADSGPVADCLPWKRRAMRAFPGLTQVTTGADCLADVSRFQPACLEPAELLTAG